MLGALKLRATDERRGFDAGSGRPSLRSVRDGDAQFGNCKIYATLALLLVLGVMLFPPKNDSNQV